MHNTSIYIMAICGRAEVLPEVQNFPRMTDLLQKLKGFHSIFYSLCLLDCLLVSILH